MTPKQEKAWRAGWVACFMKRPEVVPAKHTVWAEWWLRGFWYRDVAVCNYEYAEGEHAAQLGDVEYELGAWLETEDAERLTRESALGVASAAWFRS